MRDPLITHSDIRSFAEAREHSIALTRSDHPAYQYMRDPDADGMVCE